MSEIKKLFTQSSHYLIGQAIIMGAGFISFPILTRIFSVSDYGTVGLITTTLFFATAVVKFGFPNAIVQFYAEVKAAKRLNIYFTTILLSTSAIALLFVSLSLIAIKVLQGRYISNEMGNLLTIGCFIILTGSLRDILTSFLRAEQRTVLYNITAIARRYGSLFLSIIFVFYLVKGLYGFFLGQLLAGTIILLLLLVLYQKEISLKREHFSSDVLKTSLKFSVPLVWAEFGHLALNYVDRYLVQFYLGSLSLGLYTAAYDLSTQVTELIIYPINYAMTPIYMNILTNKGEEETKQFFTKMFRYFLLIIIPVAFGFIAIGKDLLMFLASQKYMEAYPVIPYVVVGQSIYACTIILNSGLFINKKTYIVNNIMIITCLFNIGLNVFLIPRFGIVGAAQATLLSYIIYAIVITYYSFREFKFRIDFRRIIRYALAASIMFIAVKNIHFEFALLNLLCQIGVGVLTYSLCVLILDKEIRQRLLSFS